jgi:hypothetical protein
MSERESALRFLASNLEAIETLTRSTIIGQIMALMTDERKYRLIDMKETNELCEGFNKMDDAIVELKNLVHSMNGKQADPEPHGSRDTFVPHPNEEPEHYNAMQD